MVYRDGRTGKEVTEGWMKRKKGGEKKMKETWWRK